MKERREQIDTALDEVRRQIEALVREEQLRDQLTGLANGEALSETIHAAIEKATDFWCALVEVDYFKRINDKFTYEVADGLLLRIANRLQAFEDYVSGTLPIRAHGDEFYLFGTAPNNERVAHALERLRVEIEGIRIGTRQGEMSCTVSIGWMTNADVSHDDPLTQRSVLRMVEAATGAAKVRGRNRVIRYSAAVEKTRRQSVRDDCKSCGASFTVEIPADTPHAGSLHCPNCGTPIPRPAHAQ